MYSSYKATSAFNYKSNDQREAMEVTLSSATCEEMCHIRLSLKNFMPYGPRSSDRALISEEEKAFILLQTNYIVLI